MSNSNNEDPEGEHALSVNPVKEDALSIWNYPPRESISLALMIARQQIYLLYDAKGIYGSLV